MKTIWKFPFAVSDMVAIEMPSGAKILHVEVQPASSLVERSQPCLWALVDPEAKKCLRSFYIFGTGHSLGPRADDLRHVGTFLDGAFVWHVFEEKRS